MKRAFFVLDVSNHFQGNAAFYHLDPPIVEHPDECTESVYRDVVASGVNDRFGDREVVLFPWSQMKNSVVSFHDLEVVKGTVNHRILFEKMGYTIVGAKEADEQTINPRKGGL